MLIRNLLTKFPYLEFFSLSFRAHSSDRLLS